MRENIVLFLFVVLLLCVIFLPLVFMDKPVIYKGRSVPSDKEMEIVELGTREQLDSLNI